MYHWARGMLGKTKGGNSREATTIHKERNTLIQIASKTSFGVWQ